MSILAGETITALQFNSHDHTTGTTIPVGGGGTGATNITDARNNLEVPSKQDLLLVEDNLQNLDTLYKAHDHTGSDNGPIIPITGGGTGAINANDARANLGAAPDGVYSLGLGSPVYGTYVRSTGKAIAFKLNNSNVYRIEVECRLTAVAPSSVEDYRWGFSLNELAGMLAITFEPPGSALRQMCSWMAFTAGGNTFMYEQYGYGSMVELHNSTELGYLLIPARYYTTGFATGAWQSYILPNVAIKATLFLQGTS